MKTTILIVAITGAFADEQIHRSKVQIEELAPR
jgi:hypothetical protein